MSDIRTHSDNLPRPRWSVHGKIAASVEYDGGNKQFDFLMEDGSHEVASFADASDEKIEEFIASMKATLPLTSKQ